MPIVLPPSLADFRGVLSESKRIVNAHTRHFLALSVLFLLPLSFSISVFPTLLRSLSSSSSGDRSFPVHTLLRHSSSSSFHHIGIPLETLAFVLAFSVSALLLFISAAGTLTYSSFHGFYGRPVKLPAAISSLFTNFLPLLATASACLLYIFAAISAFALYEFLAWKAICLLTAQSPTESLYFLVISCLGGLVLGLLLPRLVVNWIVVNAVVVIEHRWGFDALNRSKDLVTAMRRTGMTLILFWFCALQMAFLVWNLTVASAMVDWTLALHIVITSALLMVLLLQGMSSATVFYVYCKAVKGELEDEVPSEFLSLNLPLDDDDDDKAPLLVSVVHD